MSNASVGYAAIKKETTRGVAVTPDKYVPYYSQSMATNPNLMSDEPIIGNRFRRLESLRGMRSHTGSMTVKAEPNTAALWFDMLMNKSATTGSDPYTHTFGVSTTTDPNSYTLDISLGQQVVRFTGVEASQIGIGWDAEKMILNLELSGLKSFYGREISSISTTTVNLKTDYDTDATEGLVVGDLVYILPANGGAALSTTISTITDDDTVVLGASAAAFAAGDMLVLRPATPSLSILPNFLWTKTQFCFGVNAAAALAATQTRLDPGTEIAILNEFEDPEGAKRSGASDPAALLRTVYDATFSMKKFMDGATDIRKWNALEKHSCVMRSYAGSTNEYELRVTFNHIKISELPIPTESAGTIYQEITAVPQYDTTDGKAIEVAVINGLITV